MTQAIVATDGSDIPIDLHALVVSVGTTVEYVIPYGRDVVRTDLWTLRSNQHVSGGGASSPHYVVVITITSTPFGGGKTTATIGLVQGFNRSGQQVVLALRQSVMGPTFGIKDGAGEFGGACILPAERMNLYLTGDFHATIAAHNLLSVTIDNHLYHGNELDIDKCAITWPRALDINDHALCHIASDPRAEIDGITRQAPFDTTPVSELMVVMSLATDLSDLRRRLGHIVIGRGRSGEWISAEDLEAAGTMRAVPHDTLEPNLPCTGEGTPVLVHTDPFGSIAIGCSSVIADRIATAGARDDGCILTEAGFGSNMGLERFVDLKCAVSGMHLSVAVVMITIRALKAHSGRHRLISGKDLPEEMLQENVDSVRDDVANLLKHLQIVWGFGIIPVVAANVFPTDHGAEIEEVTRIAGDVEARVAVCRPVTRGGGGYLDLAGAVVEACQKVGGSASNRPAYEPQDDLRTKISKLADLYGADGADYTPVASRLLEAYEQGGSGHLPVIVAKTPLSLSVGPGRKGASTGWRLPVREVRLVAGAGYIYAVCGSLSIMPGLSSRLATECIDVDLDTGQVVGLR